MICDYFTQSRKALRDAKTRKKKSDPDSYWVETLERLFLLCALPKLCVLA